ncbi:3-dehydroquinate synthase [Propionispora sp. 2/2-37]|uniref:3-dehydroquinate synthase n=1 Tax=Propionispora sp. 2/2-37 TaxID=1677858 RepID=UPI0006BB5C3D|nr:3-dehydroquinate synthase [Propionispora sp. 2/2-37]CUH94097.1 3-dehydroquinate synthase [Propionispora sp. 2/2-37]
MAEVKVNAGDWGYSIHIGENNLTQTGRRMRQLGLSGSVLVISDEQVGALYGEHLLDILREEGFSPELFLVPQGESTKSLTVAEQLYSKAIMMGMERKSAIVALGGGVVGDLSGFVASTYLRGVPFVQIPTTLLAQVDSSVGGKVAVNHELGKNLIGAFYQPRLVVVDTAFLHSLSDRQLASGLAEVIKYGVIADRELFCYLRDHHRQIKNKDMDCLQTIIKRSCEIKADIVEKDEREAALRMILNFGHTIAHAVEGDTSFQLYSHGEAVAIGMHGAALLSQKQGLCSEHTVEELKTVIKNFALPLYAPECTVTDLLPFLNRDKKAVSGKINWVLLHEIGEVFINNNVKQEHTAEVLAMITRPDGVGYE